MTEHKFPYESFIGGWYISESVCDNIINFFDTNKEYCVSSGHVGSNENEREFKNINDSLDMKIGKDNYFFPFYHYRQELQKCLNEYLKKYEYANKVNQFAINTDYNLQYYNFNKGFKTWHSERTDVQSMNRYLVFMTYLNNVDDGGTEFKYQNLVSPAKKGLTLIWPTEWTHTHRSQISKTKEKYIVTGWYTFNE